MNDERPIEKLLRRAAQKRSAESGPPPELHPANRRLLHAEVARRFPPAAAAPASTFQDWWALLKRRWAYGVGLVAILWVGALVIAPLISPPKSKELLAQQTAREIGELLAARTNALPTIAPTVATHSLADNDHRPTSAAKDAAAPPPEPPAAVVATTAPRATKQAKTMAARQDVPLNSSPRAEAVAKIQPSALANRSSAPGKTAWITSADRFNQPAPTSAILPERLDHDGAAFATPTPTTVDHKLKLESGSAAAAATSDRAVANPVVSGIVADASIAPAEAAVVLGYEKSLSAEKSNATPAPVTRSAQAYANRAVEKVTRKLDADSLRVFPKVLVNFRIEQAGRDLRVVDGDGSIYTGVVDEANTLYKQQLWRQNQSLSNAYEQKFRFQTPKLTAKPTPAKTQAGEFYGYRVEGTNRTLNQKVVFTWNFVATNSLASDKLNFNPAAQKLEAANPTASFPELLQKSRITGRAQYGAGREIEVNAVPVK
jgi:hypothetical protein